MVLQILSYVVHTERENIHQWQVGESPPTKGGALICRIKKEGETVRRPLELAAVGMSGVVHQKPKLEHGSIRLIIQHCTVFFHKCGNASGADSVTTLFGYG